MPLSDRFSEALAYSFQLHREQARKASGVPYVAHLLAVVALVLEHGGTEDEAIAALLHDAIEDQGGAATRAEIARRFGEPVAQIVEGCTDTDEVPKPPWRPRKEAYIARLAAASPSVQLISAADKLHNVQSTLRDHRLVGPAVWERFTGRREQTLWYYRSVVESLRRSGANPIVEELAAAVQQLEECD